MRKPCLDKEDRNKGAWSNLEDQKLIRKHGKGCCQTLPQPAAAGMLVFSYTYKRGNFSEDEEDLIIKLHALLGNRWSLIAGRLPNRTDNEVKNYWNSHLKKKLMKMGIDPNNHKLNHIPYHITNPKLSTTVASSTQKTQATGRSDGDNEVTSDGRCCFDYDKSCGVPDLNLNLSLFTMVTLKNEEGENHNCNSKVVHSPNTLLLFE